MEAYHRVLNHFEWDKEYNQKALNYASNLCKVTGLQVTVSKVKAKESTLPYIPTFWSGEETVWHASFKGFEFIRPGAPLRGQLEFSRKKLFPPNHKYSSSSSCSCLRAFSEGLRLGDTIASLFKKVEGTVTYLKDGSPFMIPTDIKLGSFCETMEYIVRE